MVEVDEQQSKLIQIPHPYSPTLPMFLPLQINNIQWSSVLLPFKEEVIQIKGFDCDLMFYVNVSLFLL